MSNLATVNTVALTFENVERLATSIAKSGLFGAKTPEQALALMMLAQSEGLHPMAAARDYHVIEGRPAMKAEVMLARFQQAGGTVEWHEYTDTTCDATFAHPKGSKVRIKWDMATAKQAGLGGKQMWSKYPRRMLWARVVSEGVRTCFPACVLGVYTPEEIQDFEPSPVMAPMKPQAAATVVLEAEPVKESLSPEAVEGVLQSIEACKTEQALQAIGKQLAGCTLSKETHLRLGDAYRARRELLEASSHAAAALAAVVEGGEK
jgi:hypothetical protein